jgi:putative flippase GtrA
MSEYLARLVALYRTPGGKRMFRYAMVSVISTVASFAVLTLVYGVFRVWSEVPSTVFANTVATVPSYYLNRNWAWGKSGRSHLVREVLPFWTMSFIGIGLSVFSAALAKHLSDKHHLHHLASTVLVDGANLAMFGVLWVVKFMIFNRLFHVHPELEDAEVA